MPQYTGLLPDGKNTVSAGDQPSEFRKTLSDIDKEVLDAYGVDNFNQLMRQQDPVAPWFPLYTAGNKWNSSEPAAIVGQQLGDLGTEWLPKLIIDGPEKYEENWAQYEAMYNEIDVKVREDKLTEEVNRRYELEEELKARAAENATE